MLQAKPVPFAGPLAVPDVHLAVIFSVLYRSTTCLLSAADAKSHLQVRLLIGLLRKVTGVTVAAFFRSDKVRPRLDSVCVAIICWQAWPLRQWSSCLVSSVCAAQQRRLCSAYTALLQVGAIRYSGKQAEMPWHQSGGFGHDIRMWRMR